LTAVSAVVAATARGQSVAEIAEVRVDDTDANVVNAPTTKLP